MADTIKKEVVLGSGRVRLLLGDCLEAGVAGLFHACLCDPPYELGFMGKNWDRAGVSFGPETWAKIGESLHPGGFLMAFGSSRGWHRLACAIEDAGFVIHPTVFLWAFGSGFPKATRIDKTSRVDGVGERESHLTGYEGLKNRCQKCGRPFFSGNPCQCPKPKSEHPFAGHRYGLQALKPAVEPIIVAQKPYVGKPVESIMRTGAGALNIDGGRIGKENRSYRGSGSQPNKINNHALGDTGIGMMDGSGRELEFSVNGRWPSNFILLDDEAAARLDEQSGKLKSGDGCFRRKRHETGSMSGSLGEPTGGEEISYGDSGGASRFFYRVKAQLDEADAVRYCAKASRKERDAGLEAMAVRHVRTDAQDKWSGENMGNTPDSKRKPIHCHHPCVKPLDLCRYLATLLLPPKDYAPRRLYSPFAGVGSEMIGALRAGWEEVVGVESNPDYCEIADARIRAEFAQGDFLR